MEKYQFPKIKDEIQFENFTRDLLNLIYQDNSFQLYGRKGQAQDGLDGYSTIHPIFFQCKHKSSPHVKDKKLEEELEVELNKAKPKIEEVSNSTESKFLFFTTHPNATKLQDKARVLSTDSIVVEYWGWETIESYLNNLYLFKNRDFFNKYYPELAKVLTDSNKISEFDKKLYKEFLSDLPTSGAISFIYELDFHYIFKFDNLRELFHFCSKWDSAEYEFMNKDLEMKRFQFYEKLDIFLYELGMSSSPIDDKGIHSIIPKRYRIGIKPRYLLESVEKINNLSREVYKLHQEFIRSGKEYIYS